MKPIHCAVLLATLAFSAIGYGQTAPPATAPPPGAYAAPPPAPVYYTMPAPLAPVEGSIWQTIGGIVATALAGFVAVLLSKVKDMQGRQDRQAQKTGQITDHVTSLAMNAPPPGTVPVTPVAPPSAPPGANSPSGTATVLAFLLWLAIGIGACGLTGCSALASYKIAGNIAYVDAQGNSYTYVSDGTKRVLTLADKNGNAIGIGADGKTILLNATVDGKTIKPVKAGASVPLPLPAHPVPAAKPLHVMPWEA